MPNDKPDKATKPRTRARLSKLLKRVENDSQSLAIERRGIPRAVLLTVRDYVKLAAPEPEVLRILGEESRSNGTDTMTSRQIDSLIRKTRADRKSKRKK